MPINNPMIFEDDLALDDSASVFTGSLAPTLPLTFDTFAGRTVGPALGGTFGTAASGDAWTSLQANGAQIQVASGEGTCYWDGVTGVNAFSYQKLGSAKAADAMISARITFNNTAGGSASLVYLFTRMTDGNNWYAGGLAANGQVQFIKRIAGTFTTVVLATPGFTQGVAYWLKFAMVGTTYQVKWWQDGTAEPAAWQFTGTDTSIVGAAGVGLLIEAKGTTAPTGTNIDSLVALNLSPDGLFITDIGGGSLADWPVDALTLTETFIEAGVTVPVEGLTGVETFLESGGPLAVDSLWARASSLSSYVSMVLADGARAYYRLNEQSGLVVYDSAGNNANGAISASGVTLGQPGPLASDPDTSLLFAGNANSLVTLPASANGSGYSAFSVECWFNLSTTALGSFSNLVFGDSNASHNSFQSYISGTNTLAGGLGNGTTAATVNWNGYVPQTGVWVHYVMTYDGSIIRLYANGVQKVTTNYAGGALGTSVATMGVGATPGHSSPFPGSMGQVAIYNVVLTPTQIATHYTTGSLLYLNQATGAALPLEALVVSELASWKNSVVLTEPYAITTVPGGALARWPVDALALVDDPTMTHMIQINTATQTILLVRDGKGIVWLRDGRGTLLMRDGAGVLRER